MLTVRNVRLAKGGRVSLLGTTHTDVAWRQRGDDLVIQAPALQDGEVAFAGAFTFRIEGAAPQEVAP
jgi:hypothetical protein